jgi:hypothetical protein
MDKGKIHFGSLSRKTRFCSDFYNLTFVVVKSVACITNILRP